jgi:hypothetical protein
LEQQQELAQQKNQQHYNPRHSSQSQQQQTSQLYRPHPTTSSSDINEFNIQLTYNDDSFQPHTSSAAHSFNRNPY